MGATLNLTLRAAEGSANMAQNTSGVHIVLKVTTDSGTYNLTGSTRGSITVDGVEAVSLDGKAVQYNTTTTLYDGVHTVVHDGDGTRTVTVAAAFDVDTPMTGLRTAQATVTLPAIPRRATVTAPALVLGRSGVLQVDCQPGFTCDLHYELGELRGVIAEGTEGGAVVWTPPLALAAAFPNAPSAAGTLRLTTYAGGEAVGESSAPFTVAAGTELAPCIEAVAVSLVQPAGAEGWDVAVRGRTALSYTVQARGQYGAQVSGCVFSCGGVSAAGAESTTAVLSRAGSFRPRVSLTDSRGLTAVWEGEGIPVLDYEPPAFTASVAYRCGEDGSADAAGTCAAVRAAASFAALEGRNSLTLRCRSRAVDGGWSGYTALAAGEVTVLPGFNTAVSYEVEVEAVDALGERRSVVYTLSTESVAFHLRRGGLGAAFGKYAEKDGWLESAWPMDLGGNRLCGLAAPAAPDEAVPLGELETRLAPLCPAVTPGAELETAARCGGETVYLTAVEFPLLAAGENRVPLAAGGVLGLDGVVRQGSLTRPLSACPGLEDMGHDALTGELWLQAGESLAGGSALVFVKYTK